ncbi:MAG: CesT family type III secretion system chaperone [Planctomycetota bacterium]|nr:CesT family type III secretion system chaperone [Planctomycetota bacterium]
MDYDIERRYYVEKIMDYVDALENASELQLADDNRVLFRVEGRPFEALAWIDKDSDMICITTRTADMPVEKFEEAVKLLQSNLETCWEYCVAVSAVEQRYDLSMALFIGGFTFEAFEAVIHNLMSCAEAIETNHGAKKEK